MRVNRISICHLNKIFTIHQVEANMTRIKSKLILWAGLLCLGQAVAGLLVQAQTLTYTDIANRMIDLQYLAMLPEAGIKTQEFTSYDRGSTYNATTDVYNNWFANNDCCGSINGTLLAQMAQPGVIWVSWSATPGSGTLPVYFNGAANPTINIPFAQWMGGTDPFNYSKLNYHTPSAAGNCYVPIPYSSSCIIRGNSGFGNYFHFCYTSFPANATLPTWQNGSTEEKAALVKINNFLATSIGTDPAGARPGEITEIDTVRIGSGVGAVSTIKILRGGPGVITAFKVKASNIATGNKTVDRIKLRELSLRIYWDNDVTPSVWAPLGDFFGTAFGYNPYKSVPMGMTSTEFYSYWYMPYKDSAKIQLLNDGNTADTVIFTIVHSPVQNINNLSRFHAKWHRDFLLPTRTDRNQSANGGCLDWTYCKVTGKGRFVGVMQCDYNPNGGWWGEGDEKFFVDGEKFPSWFGTGNEDYFGYSWSSPDTFTRPFHSQPYAQGDQWATQNRYHIPDQIPFQTSFEGCIEKYFPNSAPDLRAATAYWYMAPGGTDPYLQLPVTDRISYFNSAYQVPPATTWKDPYKDNTADAPQKKVGFSELQKRFIAYVNRAGMLMVHVPEGASGNVEMFDLRGGMPRVSMPIDREGNCAIDASSFSEAMHVIKITTSEGIIAKKIAIANSR
jgi:hypothetical protein